MSIFFCCNDPQLPILIHNDPQCDGTLMYQWALFQMHTIKIHNGVYLSKTDLNKRYDIYKFGAKPLVGVSG